MNKAFTPRRVAQIEPSIRAIANELVDAFMANGRVELVDQFAVPLPLTVIANALGVPPADQTLFKRWSDDSVAPLGGMITPEREIECARSTVEFQRYFAAKLEERRTAPQDDLLTDLINARLEGETPLNTGEMLNILQQLLVAGNETTTNLIASGMLLLLQNPHQMATVCADHSLIPNCVEEALRAESPVQGLFRMTKVDTELGGVTIPAGSRLVIMYASGNRDDQKFPQADSFDVCRAITPNGTPSPHLNWTPTEQDMLDAMMDRNLDDPPVATVPDGMTARQFVGTTGRKTMTPIFGDDVERFSDAEMSDSFYFTLFPNFHPWGAFNRITYRFRPYGDDHRMAIMECMYLAPYPPGKRPPSAPIHWLGPDDDWTEASELGILARVFNQDVYNLPKVQRGLETVKKPGYVTFASYAETKLRHFHKLYDRWVGAE